MTIEVVDAPAKGRYEARAGEVLAGFMTYQVTGKIVAFTHTEVSPEFEGQGVGKAIARRVMDDARAAGRTVVPICPFLAGWLERHQEYADMVVTDHRRVK
ncbi:GNAT family N-acetyltransferase [Catellatospora sp. KI3]|uniref:GNAT family N-acetyltransferase n=1 Tax=Catellatospora sp. KI3 TaxID=3041620 RepID=UPI002482FC12|nr:GNAT family N-acetyltransferase [Catellatospora sp. KI3]MDI1464588.1 GNAT family N-acetyltransferase [Catellatospora sp. KI3]